MGLGAIFTGKGGLRLRDGLSGRQSAANCGHHWGKLQFCL